MLNVLSSLRARPGHRRPKHKQRALVAVVAVLASLLTVMGPQGANASVASWPSSWTAYTMVGGGLIRDVKGDESPPTSDLNSGLPCTGSPCLGSLPTVQYATDGTNAFFRMRMSDDNYDVTKGGLTATAFLVQLADSTGVVKAVVGVNGKTTTADYVYVTDALGSAVTTVYTWTSGDPVGGGFRWIADGATGEYFLDFQVPISTLTTVSAGAITASTPVKMYYGSSQAANLAVINKDFMIGGDSAVDFSNVSVVKIDAPDVTFDSQGGSAVASQTLSGATLAATEPTAPTRSGYTFVGWFTASSGGSAWNFSTTITADVTLYAHWTLDPLAQTITFAAISDATVGDTRNIAPTASSSLTVAVASTTPLVCTYSAGVVTTIATGTCTITANQAGNGTYAAAPQVSQSFTVSAAAGPQVITFANPGTRTIGDVVASGAASDSGLTVTLTSQTPSVCTVSGLNITMVGAGTCTIDADQAGNGSFNPASTVTRSFTVNKKPQSITFASISDAVLGDTRNIAPTASSSLTVAVASTTPSVCTYAAGVVTTVGLGTCTITADQAGDTEWAAATQATRSFTVSAVPLTAQTISFAQPSTGTIDDTFTPSPTATSGLAVALTSQTPLICSVSAGVVTLLAEGDCTLDADQAGNGTFSAAPTVTRTFAVVKKSQSITFTQPTDKTIDDTFTPTPSASSTLAVTLTSSTPSVCTVSGGTVTALTAGTCTLNANQGGNAVYAPAGTVSHDVTIGKKAQTITFTDPGGHDVGDTVTPTPTSSSGLTVTLTSSTPLVCTVASGVVTIVGAGTCTLNADQGGDGTYLVAPTVSHSFTASLVSNAITFAQPTAKTIDDTFTPSPTASSGLPVTLTSNTPSICTVSSGTVTAVAAGTCTLVATQAGNGTYAAATPVQRSLTVNKKSQTITFASISNAEVGDTRSISPSATSTLTVAKTSATPSVCTVSGGTVTTIAAGTCTVDADQAGDATYSAASTVSRSFTVSRKAQTISFPSPGGGTIGDDVTPTKSSDSGLGVTLTSQTPLVCTVSGGVITLLAGGTCTIDADQGGNGTYLPAATVTRSFSVGAVSQTIDFDQPDPMVIDDTVTPTPTATSGLSVTVTSSTPSVCTISGGVVTAVGAGTCTLAANQAGNATYSAAPTVSRSFTVTKKSQSVLTFPTIPDAPLGDPITLSPTSTSGLPVTLTSTTPGVCTVNSSGVVTLLSAGTCTIEATQDGDDEWSPATTVTHSFTVSKLSQTITFTQPSDMFVGDTFTPAPTASSGLTVTVTSSTPLVCTVDSDGDVAALSAGTCTLAADQAGNDVWSAAPQVSRSFAITRVAQTITLAPPGGLEVGTSYSPLPTATSLLDVTLVSTTPSVCTVVGGVVTAVAPGVCILIATQSGDGTYAPAPPVTITFPVSFAPMEEQSIAFSAPGSLLSGGGSVPLSASATSGLAVTLSLASGGCTLVGSDLTAAGDTVCTVVASQAGDSHWSPADSVSVSIQFVSPADDSVSMASPLTGPKSIDIDVLANDPTGLTLASAGSPGRGTSVLGNGLITYTPPETWHGVDVFTYQVSDSLGRIADATVSVDVANAPPTVAGEELAQLAGTTKTATATMSDPNGDPVTLTVKDERHIKGSADGRKVRVTPDETTSGWVSIKITANDGFGGTDSAQIRTLVTPLPVASATRRLASTGTIVAWPRASTEDARYSVLLDGKVVCTTSEISCTLGKILGPDFTIKVQVLGKDGTHSTKVLADPRGHNQVLFRTVYFESGLWTLSARQTHKLFTVSSLIRRRGFHDAYVSGYTDSDGGAAYNLDLSKKRTQLVVDYLYREKKITSQEAWFGYNDPAAPNDTEAGKSLNRRVEILVSY